MLVKYDYEYSHAAILLNNYICLCMYQDNMIIIVLTMEMAYMFTNVCSISAPCDIWI